MDIALRKGAALIAQLNAEVIVIENRAAELIFVILREASALLDFATNIDRLSGASLEQRRQEIKLAADSKRSAIIEDKEMRLAAVRDPAMIEIRKANHEVNVKNKSIDALFILAQHDGSKWAEDFRRVKDLCRATRAEPGLWSAMTRVHFGPKKRTLLMYETQRGCLDRVQWLLARAAQRDARDTDGLTAAYFASREGRTASLLSLIASGAGVDIAKNDGVTPLWVASHEGHIDTVRALFAAQAGVDIAANDWSTPLYVACENGHTDIVHSLIAAGASVNIAEDRGRTPLDVAIHYGYESITNALIEAGATNGPEADDWSIED